ncbi:MAG TPA: hypothetical protein ENG98_00075 [Actinobacteria bacterium]|nr:hypothetical protein [Actinomycetota bacterium]
MLSDLTPVTIAGLLLWVASRLADEWPFAALTGIGVLAVVGVLGIGALAIVAPAPPDIGTVTARPGSPDVLLLVLDGYARGDWLDEVYGYDNSPFLEELEARGFAVAYDATPNYSYTYASLSTILNLDYVFLPGGIDEPGRELMRAALTGATGMIPAFQQGGYEVTYFENAWGGSQCGSAIDRCIRHNLVSRSLWPIGQMTMLAPVVNAVVMNPFTTVSLGQLQSLGEVISEPRSGERPRLTIAHVVLPHSPMLLDANCEFNRVDIQRVWGLGSEALQTARRANYVGQLECVNQVVLDALDVFLERYPTGVVMITSDHGPASTLLEDLPVDEQLDFTVQERMKILSAYRMPGCESTFRPDLTPVNGVRLLVNCVLGADLAPVMDVNNWISSNSEGEVEEMSLTR